MLMKPKALCMFTQPNEPMSHHKSKELTDMCYLAKLESLLCFYELLRRTPKCVMNRMQEKDIHKHCVYTKKYIIAKST